MLAGIDRDSVGQPGLPSSSGYEGYLNDRVASLPQLCNLAQDPAERNDLSQQEPERLKAIMALWEQYVEDNGGVLNH